MTVSNHYQQIKQRRARNLKCDAIADSHELDNA